MLQKLIGTDVYLTQNRRVVALDHRGLIKDYRLHKKFYLKVPLCSLFYFRGFWYLKICSSFWIGWYKRRKHFEKHILAFQSIKRHSYKLVFLIFTRYVTSFFKNCKFCGFECRFFPSHRPIKWDKVQSFDVSFEMRGIYGASFIEMENI